MVTVLGLAVGSALHCGTVCTSFCWINSGTHQRTAALPLGQTDLQYVALGNTLAAVTVPLQHLGDFCLKSYIQCISKCQ